MSYIEEATNLTATEVGRFVTITLQHYQSLKRKPHVENEIQNVSYHERK